VASTQTHRLSDRDLFQRATRLLSAYRLIWRPIPTMWFSLRHMHSMAECAQAGALPYNLRLRWPRNDGTERRVDRSPHTSVHCGDDFSVGSNG
jgi:hypothetical protein